MKLLEAIKKNKPLEKINDIITKAPSLVNISNSLGETPLLYAVEKNRVDIVEVLIKKGATITSCDNKGQTALHMAAFYGDLELIRLFLEKPESIERGTLTGRTPLHYAAYGGQTDSVKILLAHGANINKKDKEGYTALNEAVLSGNAETVDELLLAGATIDHVYKIGVELGVTLLHVAAYRGFIQIALSLIKAGANIHKKDLDGKTALDYVDPIHVNQLVQASLSRSTVVYFIRRFFSVLLSAVMGVFSLGLLLLRDIERKDSKGDIIQERDLFDNDALFESSTTGLGLLHRFKMEQQLTGCAPSKEALLHAQVPFHKLSLAGEYFGRAPEKSVDFEFNGARINFK